MQAELATDMNAGLSAAERRQLAELQPQTEGLEQQLKDAKKAAGQVSHPTVCYLSTACVLGSSATRGAVQAVLRRQGCGLSQLLNSCAYHY